MAAAVFEVEFPRRQAMLSIREKVEHYDLYDGPSYYTEWVEKARVPVFDWSEA